jgi:hypothetical protein
VPVEVPVTTVAEPEQALVIDRSEDAAPEQVAPTPVEPRTLESLDLKLDDRPLAVETPSVFGAAPDSGWLDPGRDAGLDAEENGLLPDLFETQKKEKSVDVKTRVLIDENINDISAPLDGAEMSIEIKTD